MLGKDLDRDDTVESRIPRPIDFTHAARAQQRFDLIRPEFCPRSKRHPWA